MKDADVLSALPRTRPHRRSERRPTRSTQQPPAQSSPTTKAVKRTPAAVPRPAAARPTRTSRRPAKKRLPQPAQPAGIPRGAGAARKPVPPTGKNALGTAVQAAAELAELSLTLSTRAVRNALSRVPRP
jgi:hypothetical protein